MVTRPVVSRRTVLGGLGAGLVLPAVAAVAGCGRAGEAPGNEGAGEVARAEVARAAQRSDASVGAMVLGSFAGALYGAVLDGRPGNVVVSPWSINTALAMLRPGAAGVTRDQLDAALRAPRTPEHAFDDAMNTAALVLEAAGRRRVTTGVRTGQVELRSANSAWAQPTVTWKRDYLATLARYYGAGVRLTSFASDAEAARTAINAWVADQTERHIEDLVPKGVLNPLTVLVLVNALYLKAPWEEKFEKALTRPARFTLPDGRVRSVPMMSGTIERATYSSTPAYETVTLPYLGGDLAMTAVLPRRGHEKQVVDALAAGGLNRVLAGRGAPVVSVTMPRLSLATALELRSVLKPLGIVDVFMEGRADLTRMAERAEDFFVSAALHQATIEVDEEGTTATAATAVVAQTASARASLTRIVLDRPFHVVVHHVEARIPLFVAHVTDPAAAAP